MKKSIYLTLQTVLFLIVLSSVSLASLAQKHPDFSGKWKLNRSQSQLGAEFSMAPFQLTIEQGPNSLAVERISDFQGEEFTQNEKFTLDGKESKNEGFQGMERISIASWTADGKSLEIKTAMPTPDGGEITVTEIYKMNGKNLTIVHNMQGPRGDMKETWVYDKQ